MSDTLDNSDAAVMASVEAARIMSREHKIHVLPAHRRFARAYGDARQFAAQARKTQGKEREACEQKWIAAYEQMRAWGYDQETWPERRADA